MDDDAEMLEHILSDPIAMGKCYCDVTWLHHALPESVGGVEGEQLVQFHERWGRRDLTPNDRAAICSGIGLIMGEARKRVGIETHLPGWMHIANGPTH